MHRFDEGRPVERKRLGSRRREAECGFGLVAACRARTRTVRAARRCVGAHLCISVRAVRLIHGVRDSGSGSGRAKPLPFRFGRFGGVGLSQLSVRIAVCARPGGGCGARGEIRGAVVRASPMEMCGESVGFGTAYHADGFKGGGVPVCADTAAGTAGAAGAFAASHFVRPIMRMRAHWNGRGCAVPLSRRRRARSARARSSSAAGNFGVPSSARGRREFRRSRKP